MVGIELCEVVSLIGPVDEHEANVSEHAELVQWVSQWSIYRLGGLLIESHEFKSLSSSVSMILIAPNVKNTILKYVPITQPYKNRTHSDDIT